MLPPGRSGTAVSVTRPNPTVKDQNQPPLSPQSQAFWQPAIFSVSSPTSTPADPWHGRHELPAKLMVHVLTTLDEDPSVLSHTHAHGPHGFANLDLRLTSHRPPEMRPGRLLRARRADTPCPQHSPHYVRHCSTTTQDRGRPRTCMLRSLVQCAR